VVAAGDAQKVKQVENQEITLIVYHHALRHLISTIISLSRLFSDFCYVPDTSFVITLSTLLCSSMLSMPPHLFCYFIFASFPVRLSSLGCNSFQFAVSINGFSTLTLCHFLFTLFLFHYIFTPQATISSLLSVDVVLPHSFPIPPGLTHLSSALYFF
jgi:hypothetical protein